MGYHFCQNNKMYYYYKNFFDKKTFVTILKVLKPLIKDLKISILEIVTDEMIREELTTNLFSLKLEDSYFKDVLFEHKYYNDSDLDEF